MFAQALDTQFARDVRAGLTQPEQKTLPCRYLYDDIGSALFEAITFLPEYGLTRADARIIEAHADDLLDCLPSQPDDRGTGQRLGRQNPHHPGASAKTAERRLLPDRRIGPTRWRTARRT